MGKSGKLGFGTCSHKQINCFIVSSGLRLQVESIGGQGLMLLPPESENSSEVLGFRGKLAYFMYLFIHSFVQQTLMHLLPDIGKH